jgi:hypothetical protein
MDVSRLIESVFTHSDSTCPQTICLISSDPKLHSIFNHLKKEHLRGVIISFGESPSIETHITFIPWDLVKSYHTLSAQDKSTQLARISSELPQMESSLSRDVLSISSDDSAIVASHVVANRPPSPSESDEGKSVVSPSIDKSYVKTLRVSRFSMASHISNLIAWKDDEAVNGANAGSSAIDDLLLSNTGTAEGQINVSVDKDKRRQRIIISGNSESAVIEKTAFIEGLLGKLSKNRKVVRMLGWKSQHREALMGSIPLNSASQRFRATVVFHITDGHIVSELMSCNEQGITQMSDYLRSLSPREAQWKFDPKHLIPEPRTRFWNSLRNKHGVLFDRNLRKDKLDVLAWGFGSHLDDAYDDVFSASMGKAPVSHPMSAAPMLPQTRNKREIPNTMEIVSCSSLSQYRSTYQFLHMDSWYFYQSYEDMYQRYFLQRYQVRVSPQNSMGGGVTLEIRGAPDGVRDVIQALNDLRDCINTHSVHFPSVDEKKYNEIVDLQVLSLF